jgi:hypothetical protein
MTEETTQESNPVNISVEQICAAIVNKLGKIELSLPELLTDFSNKSIAVNQDPETQSITFELADNPVEETQQETAE